LGSLVGVEDARDQRGPIDLSVALRHAPIVWEGWDSHDDDTGPSRRRYPRQTRSVIVLGVDVDADLLRRWQGWLAPQVQPFFVESLRSWPESARAPVGLTAELSPELRDTYKVWKLDRSLETLWLDEETFFTMSRSERAALVRAQVEHRRGAVPAVRAWADLLAAATLRSQADGHRFVWWPSLLAGDPDVTAQILSRTVAADALPNRHRDVTRKTWDECAEVLPAARALAGSFPSSSGANCFGTVMATAGVDGAAEAWMLQGPFLDWLDSACQPSRRQGHDDDHPGTVLVWRNRDGLPVHAAVTIGHGWALEKPSQEWSTPRVVLRVPDLIRANRSPGQRLERHRIRSSYASRPPVGVAQR